VDRSPNPVLFGHFVFCICMYADPMHFQGVQTHLAGKEGLLGNVK
jgi:hypothetical protein